MKLVAILLIGIASFSEMGCQVIESVPGATHYRWRFESGETAIDHYGRLLGYSPEVEMEMSHKLDAGETLTGRHAMFERGETSKNVLYTAGTPVHMRKSERQGADMEWEYGFCIAFFFRDRIVDVQWKESPDEPQPIYRWSGKVILK